MDKKKITKGKGGWVFIRVKEGKGEVFKVKLTSSNFLESSP